MVASLKAWYLHIAIVFWGASASKALRHIAIAIGCRLESNVFPHYNRSWPPLWKHGILHYNCCWMPL